MQTCYEMYRQAELQSSLMQQINICICDLYWDRSLACGACTPACQHALLCSSMTTRSSHLHRAPPVLA